MNEPRPSPPADLSSQVTLRQLRAFVAVARLGSFTDAARTMHLSQAALSGLIKTLESQVGVRLFERSTRRVSPSAVGSAFLPEVERVLDELDLAMTGLTRLKELRRGVVRIAAPETLSCTLLPELIAAYRRAHPAVELRFRDVPIETVLAGLEDGRVDVGFGPTTAVTGDRVVARTLWEDDLGVALRPADPLAQTEPLTWRDLREHTIYTYMRRFEPSVLEAVPQRARPTRIEPVQRVNTALSMVVSHGGGVVAPSLVRQLANGFGLTFRPLAAPVVRRGIALYGRRQAALSPAVQSFADFTVTFAPGWAERGMLRARGKPGAEVDNADV